MVFSCKNCGKRYRIEPALYETHPVRFICRKCAQEHIIRKSDDPAGTVTAVGDKGSTVRSTTRELSTILVKSDVHSTADLRPETNDNWYITVMGQRQGPLSRAALRDLLNQKKITPRTFVWRAPMPAWIRLKDLPELAELFEEPRQEPVRSPIAPPVEDNEKTVVARMPEFGQDRRPVNPFDNPTEFKSSASSTSPAGPPRTTERRFPARPDTGRGSDSRAAGASPSHDEDRTTLQATPNRGVLADDLFRGLPGTSIDIRKASEVQEEEPLIVPMAQRRRMARDTVEPEDVAGPTVTWAFHDDESIMPPPPHPTEGLELHEVTHLANRMDNAHRRRNLILAAVAGSILVAAVVGGIAAAVHFGSTPETRGPVIKPVPGKQETSVARRETKPVKLPDSAILKSLDEKVDQAVEGSDVIRAGGSQPKPAIKPAQLPAQNATGGKVPDLEQFPGQRSRTAQQELARVNPEVKSDYARYGKLLNEGKNHEDKEVDVTPKTVTGMGNQQMDSKKINDFFAGKLPQFRNCRAEMARQIDATVDINLSFTIQKSGQVGSLVVVPVGITDVRLVNCLKRVVSGWVFPPQNQDTEFRTRFGI